MPSQKALEDRTVAEVMTTDLPAIDADESIIMAWELMRRARIHHLPVIGHGNRSRMSSPWPSWRWPPSPSSIGTLRGQPAADMLTAAVALCSAGFV